MNQKDDDKATAKLLLSTDEAVAEKIRRVLMSNPDLLREAVKNMQLQDELRNRDLQRQMYQQQTALQAQGMRNAYTNDNQGQVVRAQDFWSNVFGGKK